MKRRIEIEIDGEKVSLIGQVVRGQVWFHYQGHNLLFEPEALKASAKKQNQKRMAGQITAPMPGKITKLNVQVGQNVKKGDFVLMMEAMKMEYTMKAEVTGLVESIQCQVGEQVTLGKILVNIIEQKEKA